MPTPSPYEIATAIAAVVSAVGGCAAAVAAVRSATSARETATFAEESARRTALREVSFTATTIIYEAMNLRSRGQEVDTEFKLAKVLSGSSPNPGLDRLQGSGSDLALTVQALVTDAELFARGARPLEQSPLSEIDRVLVRLTESLATVRAVREELDRKYAATFARNTETRQAAAR